MRNINQITKVVDKFIANLNYPTNMNLRGLRRFIYDRESDFGIAISLNGKKFITSPRFGRTSFNGIIDGKYNVNIYKLLSYMSDLGVLNVCEVETYRTYLYKQDEKRIKEYKIYDLVEKINLIIAAMRYKFDTFDLTGSLEAQGEEWDNRYIIKIKNGWAVKTEKKIAEVDKLLSRIVDKLADSGYDLDTETIAELSEILKINE